MDFMKLAGDQTTLFIDAKWAMVAFVGLVLVLTLLTLVAWKWYEWRFSSRNDQDLEHGVVEKPKSRGRKFPWVRNK
jgi:membrane protein YdbS with pleckstrin-like domain